MRIFKTKSFEKWADTNGVTDEVLITLTLNIEDNPKGFTSLGGGLYKPRVATNKGKGKSSGSRIILAIRVKHNSIFVYAFDKSEKGNISSVQKEKFKKFAKEFFTWTDEQLNEKVRSQALYEIGIDNQTETDNEKY